jgi:hypothetical protein
VTFKTRSTAVVAGVFISLAGAFAVMAPASAATANPSGTLSGTAACTSWGWNVAWKLRTTGTGGAVGVISKVSFTYEIPPIPPGQTWTPPSLKTFPENGTLPGDGVFTDTQDLQRYFRTAELGFTVTWPVGRGVSVKTFKAVVPAPSHCVYPTPTQLPPPSLPKPTTTGTGVPIDGGITTPSASVTSTAPATSATTPAPVALAVDTSGTSGGLPVTGVAAGTLAAGAAVLLGAGSVLFVVSRRRRVRFTA